VIEPSITTLEGRPLNEHLVPDPRVPDDTRLWAALQAVGGGCWGGCVYDVDGIIDALGIRDRLEHIPAEMSGGQQQRVACARALAGRPDVLFCDEPTGNLDSKSGAEVLDILVDAAHRLGRTVVMVTHDPSAAARADRVVFLGDGRLLDELVAPTAVTVIERMAKLEALVP